MRDFDRATKRAQGIVESRYGPALARHLITEARQEFVHVIPDLPDLGGKQPFARFVAASGWFLAFHRALTRSGRPVRESGELAYALTEQYVAAVPWVGRTLIRWLWFSKLFQKRVRFRAQQSQGHRQRGEFVYEYVQGDGQQFEFGVDYLECAVWTFLKGQGAPELAPYLCALDQLYSDAFRWGLVRTTTLAEGGPRCDFRFKRGGKTRIASSVLPLRGRECHGEQ
jgi:hypothetical protein